MYQITTIRFIKNHSFPWPLATASATSSRIMEANLLPHHRCSAKPPNPFLTLNQRPPFKASLRPTLNHFPALKATNDSSSTGEDGNTLPSITQPDTPPQERVEIRYRRGARRKSREKQTDNNGRSTKKPSPPKDWEAMTTGEKVIELLYGEKGALFWLNKLAYASIYIVIGAWILFRFVGPSLGLYQLDTPPLSPTNILKGS